MDKPSSKKPNTETPINTPEQGDIVDHPAQKRKSVNFVFDEPSMEVFKEIQERGGYLSLADTLNEALAILRTLQKNAEKGYRKVFVYNPEKHESNMFMVPSLEMIHAAESGFDFDIPENPDESKPKADEINERWKV